MPQAITYLLAYAASSAGIAVGSALLTAAGYALTIGGAIAIGNAQRRKAMRRARDAYNANLQDRLVMTATADAARSRVYGRARNVDGVLFKATRGTNSEIYTLVIAVAGHEVDAIEDVYFNDLKVTLDGSGYVQTAPYYQTTRKSATAGMTVSAGAGSVVLPFTPVAGSVSVTFLYPGDGGQDALPFTVSGSTVTLSGASSLYNGDAVVNYQYDEGKSYARVRKYLGAPGQDLSSVLQPLFPSLITSTDKFQGIALLLVDLEYSQDAFPTGVPQMSAVVRGAKCFDPRTSTTVWTQNPAVIARDWSLYTYGGGCVAAQIGGAGVIAAANACDVDTTFILPSGAVTMDTYQAGIVCRLDADPTQALDEMVEAMAGRWGWAGGVLQMVAGAYRAPVATITEDWISDASEIKLVPQPPRSELVNSYTATISNRDNNYVAEPAPRIAPASYITADGREYPREIQMSAVTHIAHAQHITGVMLRDARESLTIELPCKLHAWQLELFDVVAVTLPHFGWSAKTFEVLGWRFSLNGGVVLTLKEIEAAIYDPDAGFADLGNDDNTELPRPWEVPAISGFNVTAGTTTLTDGSIVTRALASWTAIADAGVTQAGRVEVQYLEVGASIPAGDWPSQVESGNATSTTIVGLRSGRLYLFRARAINGVGVRGPWTAQKSVLMSLPPTGDLTLVNDGNCEQRGNSVVKLAGGGAWNAGMRSADAYPGGAWCSVVKRSDALDGGTVWGLNQSATTASYTDIDFGWNFDTSSNTASIYEEGASTGVSTGLAAGDVFSIVYDGNQVRYMRNATVVRTVTVAIATPLFFDCSLFNVGGTISGIRFGPMSRLYDIQAPQLNVAVGGGNLFVNGTMSLDSNGDGVPDSWVSYTNGSTGTITRTLTNDGVNGGKCARIEAGALGTTTGDQAGQYQQVTVKSLAGQKLTMSAWFSASAQLDIRYYVDWYNASNSIIGSAQRIISNTASVALRREAATFVVPSNSEYGRFYIWMQPQSGRSSGAAALFIDDAKLEIGDVPTAWLPASDDKVGIDNPITPTNVAKVIGANSISDGAVENQVDQTFAWTTDYQDITTSFALVSLTAPSVGGQMRYVLTGDMSVIDNDNANTVAYVAIVALERLNASNVVQQVWTRDVKLSAINDGTYKNGETPFAFSDLYSASAGEIVKYRLKVTGMRGINATGGAETPSHAGPGDALVVISANASLQGLWR